MFRSVQPHVVSVILLGSDELSLTDLAARAELTDLTAHEVEEIGFDRDRASFARTNAPPERSDEALARAAEIYAQTRAPTVW